MTKVSLALLACAALAWGCGSGAPVPASDPAASAPRDVVELSDAAMTNGGIVIDVVRTALHSDPIPAPGTLTLDETRTARIGALQEGLILDTSAQVGDRVRTRQVLARMHSHDVHDGWAGYRKALAERRRSENQRAFAVEAYERARRLYTDKAVSLQEVQRADVDRVAAIQAVDVAQAEVLRAQEELEHLGIEVPPTADAPDAEIVRGDGAAAEQIPIRSPIGGVVLERLVTPGTTVTTGTPLFVVSDLSTLWAVAEIDETLLPRVAAGQSVAVSVAAYPDHTFPGTVTFVADLVNPKTRRITVRATVPNPDGRLKPEMYATVALGSGAPRPVLVVPEAAIQTVDGRTVVFVERERGRFVARPIVAGTPANGQVPVTAGLAEGERVATAGSFVLKSALLAAAGD